MQFNDNVRVYKYKGTVTKEHSCATKLCKLTCVSTTMPTLCSTPKKLRIALRGESDQRQTLKTAPKCAARRAYSTHVFTINHDQY